MSRKEQRRNMNSIWHYTQRDHQNPEKALKLVEKLLQEEQDNGGKMLKQGAVWNVLRSCRRLQEPLSDSCVASLESSLALLRREFSLVSIQHDGIFSHASFGSTGARPSTHESTLTLLAQSLRHGMTRYSCRQRIQYGFTFTKMRNKQEGAEMALLLLERLLEQDDKQQVVSKGMIFNVLRNCQEHPSFSLHILERLLPLLEQCKLLDAKNFNEVLLAMTKCRNENAVARAEAILKGILVYAAKYISLLYSLEWTCQERGCEKGRSSIAIHDGSKCSTQYSGIQLCARCLLQIQRKPKWWSVRSRY